MLALRGERGEEIRGVKLWRWGPGYGRAESMLRYGREKDCESEMVDRLW